MIRILGVGNSLITGLQGAGKSHFVMSQIKLILEQRPELQIYLVNVDGVTLQSPNLHIKDANFSWVDDCDNNSVIIYDEAGTINRFNNSSRAINSNPQVLNLTMARHQGKEIVFVAQDSSIVHHAVRRLLTRHFHFSNPYNNPNETHCFVFAQVQDRLDGQNKSWHKNAIEEFKHKLDPEIFPLYKSVDDGAVHKKKRQHNAKAKFLIRLAIISVIIAIPLLAFVVYMSLSFYSENLDGDKVQDKINSQNGVVKQDSDTSLSQKATNTINPVRSNDEVVKQGNRMYIREQQLYQQRLPQDYQILSANDDLRIAMVISGNGSCRALNVKGERLNVSKQECLSQLTDGMIKPRGSARVVTNRNEPLQGDTEQQNQSSYPSSTQPQETPQNAQNEPLNTSQFQTVDNPMTITAQ